MIHLLSHGGTDRGHVRRQNEDAYLVDDERRLYAVADGLGGLPNGALASQTAIEHVRQASMRTGYGPHLLAETVRAAHEAVVRAGRASNPVEGIATTLTLALIEGDTLHVAHVGDCAAFHLRQGKFRQLTTDHTLAEEIRAEHNGEPRHAPVLSALAHTLTRTLGQLEEPRPDVFMEPLAPGDRLLLCSDGIGKTLSPGALARILESSDHPASVVAALIASANAHGGSDNSTAIALFVEG